MEESPVLLRPQQERRAGLVSRWVLRGIYGLAVMGQEHPEHIGAILCVLDSSCGKGP